MKHAARLVGEVLSAVCIVSVCGAVTVTEHGGVVTIDNGRTVFEVTLANATWAARQGGAVILSNVTAEFAGTTLASFTAGPAQADVSDGIGTGKRVTFMSGGTAVAFTTYDHENFCIIRMSRSGASGTARLTGRLASGAPSNPSVMYHLDDSTQRPVQTNLGSSAQQGVFVIYGYERANRRSVIAGSAGIELAGQRASLTRASDGLTFSVWCTINSSGASQPFAVFGSTTVYRDMYRYGDIVKVYNDIRISTWIPCGVCTWDIHNQYLSATDAYLIADQLNTTRLKDYGYTLLQIDDGWQNGYRCSGTWWAAYDETDGRRWCSPTYSDRSASSQFNNNGTIQYRKSVQNNDMKGVLQTIRDKGIIPGLWFGPYDVEGNPDWRGFTWGYSYPALGVAGDPSRYDLSKPEVLTFFTTTYQHITNDWGCAYYKFDFMYGGSGTIQQRRATFDAIRLATKPTMDPDEQGMFILYSNAPQFHSIKAVDSIRAGDDVGVVWNLGATSVYTVAPAILSVSLQWQYHRRLWLTDADQVHVRNSLTASQARTWATMIGLSGGLNLIGDQFWAPSECSADRLAMLKKIAPPYPDAAVPVDLFEHNTRASTTANPDYPNFFVIDVDKSWGRWHVVGLYNWRDAAQTLTLDFPLRLEVAPDQPMLVYDVWNDTVLGEHTGSLALQIPAQDVRVVVIAPKTTVPRVLATTRHITGGAMDLVQCSWDAGVQRLTGTSTHLVTGVPYTLVLYCPPGFSVQSAYAGPAAMQVQQSTGGVTRVTLASPAATTVSWTVNFGSGAANVPPTAALTSPVNNSTFTAPATVQLAATANDADGTVVRVEFYAGATLLGTDTASPWSFAWQQVAAGNYSLTAVAYDNAGAPGTSAAVGISVLQPGVTYYTLSIGVSPANAGTVSLQPAGGVYAAGTSVLLTAMPAEGYVFDSWSGDLSGADASAAVVMNADKTVTAVFRAAGPDTSQPVRLIGGSAGYVDARTTPALDIVLAPSAPGDVTVKIYTVRGRLVWQRRLAVPGVQTVRWPLTADDGSVAASGVYLVKVSGAGLDIVRRIAVVR